MRSLAEIIPLRTGECREAVDAIAQMAAGEQGTDTRSEAHVAACLRCQAEVAAYRRILRTMREMRAEDLPVPDGSLAEALAALEQASGPSTWAVRAAYVGGITVATAAAGAAGVLVWFSRRRPGLAETG